MLNLYILNETYTNGFNYNLLNLISVISVLCGILVIVSKNPIVSVLFLIGLFFSIASYLMMLGINFIGLSYLLVYVGAVSILFLFILMLINVRISELTTDNSNSFFLAIIIGILLFTSIYAKGNRFHLFSPFSGKELEVGTEKGTMSLQFDDTMTSTNGIVNDITHSLNHVYYNSMNNISFATSQIWDGALGELSHISSIGSIIYTNYPLWLILTSIILLLAMVGAIIITIKQ